MDVFFSALDFLATAPGFLLIGAIAAAMILLWDWRASLLGLFVIQLSVATIAVELLQLDARWAAIQTAIMLLCCLILGISGRQTPVGSSWHQSGSMLLRVLVLILLYVCWRLFEFNITIPLIRPDVTVLFMWLGICALLTLSLNDNPLFTGTALLQWCIPAQVVTATLLPIPNLIVLLGVLQLLLALGCSYMVLVEYYGYAETPEVATDITFPWKSLPVPSRGVLRLPGDASADYARTREMTAIPALPAVSSAQRDGQPMHNGGSAAIAPTDETHNNAADRTGEHPLIARLGRRKSQRKLPDRSPGNASSSVPPASPPLQQ